MEILFQTARIYCRALTRFSARPGNDSFARLWGNRICAGPSWIGKLIRGWTALEPGSGGGLKTARREASPLAFALARQAPFFSGSGPHFRLVSPVCNLPDQRASAKKLCSPFSWG